MTRGKGGGSRTGGRGATDRIVMGEYALAVGLPDVKPPDGWTWTKLTDVARMESGHTPSRRKPEYWGGAVPWMGIKDARDYHGEIITETCEYTNQLGLDNSSSRLLPAGTVCLSRTASVGYVVVMGRDMATSQDFVNWVCSERVDPQFLKHLLISEKPAYGRFSSGAVHQTIYYPEVKAFHVCLPPICVQKRIVSILDEAFGAIEKAKENAEGNLANAKELFDSYLDGVFTRQGEGWVECEIQKHITFIDYRGKTPKKLESGLRLITAKNVKMGFLRREPEEFVDASIYEEWMTRGIPKKGDVLFTTEAPLGNVAQLDTSEKVVFAQRLITLQPDPGFLRPGFLKFALLSSVMQSRIQDRGTGATVKGIKSKLLKTVLIPLPTSLGEQERLEAVFSMLWEKRNELEDIYTKKLAALDELKQSLLQKAFTGQLTAKSPELELVG